MICKTCNKPMDFMLSKREHGNHEEIEWCPNCGTIHKHELVLYPDCKSSDTWYVPQGVK